MHASASIIIERPIRDVFEAITDLGSLARWRTRFSTVDVPSGAPLGLGTVFGASVTRGRRTKWLQYQVTVFDPPHRFAFKAVDDALGTRSHVECIGLGGTTQVHLFADTEPDGFQARFAEAVLGPVQELRLERQLHHELGALQTMLQQEPASPAAYVLARVAA